MAKRSDRWLIWGIIFSGIIAAASWTRISGPNTGESQ